MHVEIDLYSGRPNPGWSLTAEDSVELMRRVAALPPAGDAGTDAANDALGYRGLLVSVANGSDLVPAPLADTVALHVGAGMVTVTRHAGTSERRLDAGHALACWLLGRACGQVDEDVRRYALDQQGSPCE